MAQNNIFTLYDSDTSRDENFITDDSDLYNLKLSKLCNEFLEVILLKLAY